ncbi:MAG TPA: hypothetical protein VIT92_13075 [Burkholderiaceae bacterium]
MPQAEIRGYEVTWSARELPGSGWAAYVEVIAPSSNPMHRNVIFPRQRVLPTSVFPDCATAEEKAHGAALDLLT